MGSVVNEIEVIYRFELLEGVCSQTLGNNEFSLRWGGNFLFCPSLPVQRGREGYRGSMLSSVEDGAHCQWGCDSQQWRKQCLAPLGQCNGLGLLMCFLCPSVPRTAGPLQHESPGCVGGSGRETAILWLLQALCCLEHYSLGAGSAAF